MNQALIHELETKALQAIHAVKTLEELRQVELLYIGRKGKLTEMLKKLKDLDIEKKKTLGHAANATKKNLEQAIQKRHQEIKPQQSSFDVTMEPLEKKYTGRLHPVSRFEQTIWKVFQEMNFDIIQTPDIETDYYNFQSLNVPADHPARDMHDTFYVDTGTRDKDQILLRTHTTAMQARYMEKHKPPLRVINIGKCYRRDSDLTHTPMFHQFDGLWVDKEVTMADLKGLLQTGMSKILEQDVKVRFRISYFPFVEPGAEFDVSCTICNGKGCPTCKKSGWIEMGGCGVVHPAILKNVGLNPDIYQGIAWGFGVERPFMIKHRINDLRLFFENDLRFLRQF